MMNNIDKIPFFRSSELYKLDITRRDLYELLESGAVEKVYHGVYRSTSYLPQNEEQFQDLALAAACIKSGVICLISALYYYEMTDRFMNQNWIAVPNSTSRINFPNTKIVRMRNLEVGVSSAVIAEIEVNIFDRERTIVDAFRYLDKETGFKALKSYLSSTDHKPQIDKVIEYSKLLRASQVASYVEVLIS